MENKRRNEFVKIIESQDWKFVLRLVCTQDKGGERIKIDTFGQKLLISKKGYLIKLIKS